MDARQERRVGGPRAMANGERASQAQTREGLPLVSGRQAPARHAKMPASSSHPRGARPLGTLQRPLRAEQQAGTEAR
jgi:hypothetical protein